MMAPLPHTTTLQQLQYPHYGDEYESLQWYNVVAKATPSRSHYRYWPSGDCSWLGVASSVACESPTAEPTQALTVPSNAGADLCKEKSMERKMDFTYRAKAIPTVKLKCNSVSPWLRTTCCLHPWLSTGSLDTSMEIALTDLF